MKTTIDLPDDLLIEAKTLAVRRKTSLKAIVEHALRREIRPAAEQEKFDPEKYELGSFGILSLKKRGSAITAQEIQQLVDNQYHGEDARVTELVRKTP